MHFQTRRLKLRRPWVNESPREVNVKRYVNYTPAVACLPSVAAVIGELNLKTMQIGVGDCRLFVLYLILYCCITYMELIYNVVCSVERSLQ